MHTLTTPIGLSLILALAACGAQPPQSQPTQRYKSGTGLAFTDDKTGIVESEDLLALGLGALVVAGLVTWWALSGDDPPAPAQPRTDRRPTYDDMDLDEIFDR